MIRPAILIPAAVLLVVVLFFIISYTNPPAPAGPPLARREAQVVRATIDRQHQRAAADTLAAQAATAAAQQAHAAAHTLRQQALLVHAQSKTYASPIPATDSAAAELQRFFATYGDR